MRWDDIEREDEPEPGFIPHTYSIRHSVHSAHTHVRSVIPRGESETVTR